MSAIATGLLTLMLAGAAEDFTWYGETGTPAPGKAERKRKPRFTISKETTYVTGPLDKDGYPDYVTALNERLSQGVTPENNAAVLFWKAFGPRPEGVAIPPEFFKRLGYQPPERGEYFIELLSYIKKRFQVNSVKQAEKIDEQLERAAQRPWTVTDYPPIASWLKTNGHALALVVEGTRRSHYYSPLVPDPVSGELPGLAGAPLPGVEKCQEVATALTARAMLRLAEGRYDDSWRDLLACHRLGRLVARGRTLIEGVAGRAIDRAASNADLTYLHRADLSAKQIMSCLRDLRQLPAMPALADTVSLGERFVFLDAVMTVDRGGWQALLSLIRREWRGKAPDPPPRRFWEKLDWDATLREANRWYDRLAAALRLKDRREREIRLARDDVRIVRVNLLKLEERLKANPGAKDVDEIKGKILGHFLMTQFLPTVQPVQESIDRTEQIQRNLHTAFALAAYRRDHGRYPRRLEALAPTYLRQVPRDLFSGKPLIYHPSEKGYLLYSVGVNGEDDQGRSEDDDPPGDDLVVRMPLPPMRRD